MYLTYSEYQNMGGTLEEAAFNDFEFEAESIINWYTFNRLVKEQTFSEPVKKLMYRLITLCQLKGNALSVGQPIGGSVSNGVIASQSNDGFSTSFNVLSASAGIEASDAEIKRLVKSYLSAEVNSLGHKLLYRGLYPDE